MRADRSMPSRASCASTWPPTSPGRAARHRPWAATRPRTIACAAAAHRDLAWLATAIGAVRDLDVLGETLRKQAGRVDPELRREVGPLGVALHEQHERTLAELGATLDAKRSRRLLERLAVFADSRAPVGRGARLGDVAPDLLRPQVRAVVRAGRRLGPDAAPPDLHRLRIRVKRLRYAVETLRSLGDRSVREVLVRLERLQDTLGKGQDAATAIAWLRGYAATRGVPAASLLPAGALIQALARRVRKQRRRGLKAWRRLERTRLLESVLKELAAEASPPREAARA